MQLQKRSNPWSKKPEEPKKVHRPPTQREWDIAEQMMPKLNKVQDRPRWDRYVQSDGTVLLGIRGSDEQGTAVPEAWYRS